MDRRAFLLLGAAGVSGVVSSWFPPLEPSGDILGRTSDTSGLLALSMLDDRADPYFDPNHTTMDGVGNGTVEYSSAGGFTMIRGQHDGSGEFAVSAAGRRFTADGSGQLLAGYPMTAGTQTLEVTASGEWDLTLAQPSAPTDEVREPPARAAGTGDVIVGPVDTTGDTTVTIDHEGDGTISVSLALERSPGVFDPERLVESTTADNTEVTTRMAGTAWVVVAAAGSWTLTFERAI